MPNGDKLNEYLAKIKDPVEHRKAYDVYSEQFDIVQDVMYAAEDSSHELSNDCFHCLVQSVIAGASLLASDELDVIFGHDKNNVKHAYAFERTSKNIYRRPASGQALIFREYPHDDSGFFEAIYPFGFGITKLPSTDGIWFFEYGLGNSIGKHMVMGYDLFKQTGEVMELPIIEAHVGFSDEYVSEIGEIIENSDFDKEKDNKLHQLDITEKTGINILDHPEYEYYMRYKEMKTPNIIKANLQLRDLMKINERRRLSRKQF